MGWGSEGWCRCRLIYSLRIYLYIAELIALHEIKSAMDIAMHWEAQAHISYSSHSIPFYRILRILGDFAYFAFSADIAYIAFYRILHIYRILGIPAYLKNFAFYRELRILRKVRILCIWVIHELRILRKVDCYALTSHTSLGVTGVSTFAYFANTHTNLLVVQAH